MKFGEILKLKEDPEYIGYKDMDFKTVANLNEVHKNIKKAEYKPATELHHMDYGFIVHMGKRENRTFIEEDGIITAYTWESDRMDITHYGHDLHGYEHLYTVVGNLKDIEISEEYI